MTARKLLAARTQAKIRGSGLVTCDDPTCRTHRKRCLFGRGHTWQTWYDHGRLVRTTETLHCHFCDGVCIAEENA